MVVAHFLIGQRRRLRGAGRERTAMAGAVALAAQGYIAAIDEKAWAGPRRSAGRPVPISVTGIPTETAPRAEYASARSSHPFGAGLDRSPVAARGQAVVRRTGT